MLLARAGIIAAAGGVVAPAVPAGTLLSAASEPIASGLVFFTGSAPSGSTLLGRDQVAGNANTSLSGGNLARINADHGSWLCIDFTAAGLIGWPITTQLRTITNRFSIAAHVVIDTLQAAQTIVNAMYVSPDDAPWSAFNFRRGTGNARGRVYITDGAVRSGALESTVDMFAATGTHWMVATWDGSLGTPELKFYLDGAQLGATITAGVPNGPVDFGSTFPGLFVGGFSPGNTTEGWDDGAFYTLGIWNRVPLACRRPGAQQHAALAPATRCSPPRGSPSPTFRSPPAATHSRPPRATTGRS